MGFIVILSKIAMFFNFLWFRFLSLPGINLLDKILYGIPAGAVAALEDIPQTAQQNPHSPWTHSFITANGVRLHLASAGPQDAPLMLCVHGFPECWYSWRNQLVEFSSEYRVVAVDMRGYNTSEKPALRSDYHVSHLVQDIRAVITGLGYQKAVLVAHDWGGGVAWRALYDIPQHLERVVIMNAPHPGKLLDAFARDEDQIRASWYMFAFQLPFVPEAVIRKVIGNVFYDSLKNPQQFTAQDNNEYVRAIHQPGCARAAINWYRNIFTPGAQPDLRQKIALPTLLIWGQDDSALLQNLTQGCQQYFAQPQLFSLKLVPSASHWVSQDQPELVTHLMRSFLNKKN